MDEDEKVAWQKNISVSSIRAKEAIAFWLIMSRHKLDIESVVDARVKAQK
jgi:hypothetical protein